MVTSDVGDINVGYQDGLGTTAMFNAIVGIAVDDISDSIYVGESYGLIRKVDSQCTV